MSAASSSQWQASPSMQGELSAFLAQHGWSARVEAHEWSRSIAHDPTKKAVASSGKEPTSPRVTLPKLPQSPRRSDFSKPSPVSASGRAQQADEKIRDDPIARARRRGSSHAAPPLGCRCRVMSMEPSPSPTLAEAAVDHKAALSLSLSLTAVSLVYYNAGLLGVGVCNASQFSTTKSHCGGSHRKRRVSVAGAGHA